MPEAPLLLAIDAYSDPGGLYPAAGARPAILDTLEGLSRLDGPPPLAPLVMCDADAAARARGALLVTDDRDGVVIVLPRGVSAGSLGAIAAAHAWRLGTPCRLQLVAAGQPADSGRTFEPRLICEGRAFHDSQLTGCIVPSEWLMLAIKTGDLL